MGRNRLSNLPIGIDIEESERKDITDGLSRLLADTFTRYPKTHNYRWNVVGPMFQTLRLMFGVQYNKLALAVDLIAERIRALGAAAAAPYREFGLLSAVREDDDRPDATKTIRRLITGQETLARSAQSIFPIVEKAHDKPTADLLTQRLLVHEKTALMLKSLLD